jgi:hypothetical protein
MCYAVKPTLELINTELTGRLARQTESGSKGGFEWSSQHLDIEGVADGSESGAADESGWAVADAVARASCAECA